MIDEQLASMNLQSIDQLTNLVGNNTIFSAMSPGEIIKGIVNGDPLFSFDKIISNVLNLLLTEVYGSFILGVQLVIICIIIGLLKNLSTSFGDDTVSKLGTIVCSCSVMALCLKSFMDVYTLCINAVDTMTVTMQALLPVLVPLLISMGSFASGGVLNPVIVAAITIFNSILQRLVLPAVLLSSIFILVNSLSDRDYVKKLAIFMRNFAIFMVGLSVTLFSGLTAIQGIVTKTTDGMIAKTAKYSMDNFIPIVGGFAADSIDLVLSCATIIKNGIGIFGLLIIITLLVLPLIKILVIALVYKITAIVIEPIGNETVSDCINEMGNSVITLAVILFLSAMMFIIFLAVIIGIGGGSLWK